jgi:hypothetical protein
MRFVTTLLLGTTLALPAMAQTAPTPPKPHHTMRHTAAATPQETINDKGPFTPEANRAYDGGGAILESAPGGPPPPASAVLGMPPGQPLAR